jgi:CubicO group peptidase (beta-lactamase class C family)
MPKLTRRNLITSTAALGAAALPLRHLAAATDPFEPVLDAARGLEQLHSLSIAVDGDTRLAQVLRGPPLGATVNIKSLSKTVVAALTGIAIDRGQLSGPDARLGAVAPGLIPANADPGVADLTMADLLTMQAGLERTSGPNYGGWVMSRDWVADALARPMVQAPGGGMLYSTGSYHVLGAVLTEVTGRSLLQLARDWLGEPLGTSFATWTRDPQGRFLGGNNMGMTVEGLLRLGETYRRGGLFGGEPVLSPAWVAASWLPRTRSNFSNHDYGYGWFLTSVGNRRLAYGRGYGGQMLFVMPALALTVVVTSDPNRPARSQGHAGALHRLLAERIVPAVLAAG